jgi:hypothetical protein
VIMISPAKLLTTRHAVLSLSTFAVMACGGDTTPDPAATSDMVADASAASPNVVEVSAGDYFYTMADTIAAGATTFRLTTNGQELHHMQLVRVPDDKSLDDLMGAMQGGPPPDWAQFVGGPNAPTPMAGTSNVTLDLQPGKYIALCVIPSPDGAPHVAKGMSRTVIVAPNAAPPALPTATATMSLTDYDFVLSAPLTAGSHVLQVTNNAEQEHEVFIAKLAPGVTPAQLVAWIEKPEGPPPGEAVGGTVGMEKGMSNFVHLDLTPGEYALICFVPDVKDGKPHLAHGMIKQISVL